MVPTYVAQWLSASSIRNIPSVDYFWMQLKSLYPEDAPETENEGNELESDGEMTISSNLSSDHGSDSDENGAIADTED
jgi:hypothetical protein